MNVMDVCLASVFGIAITLTVALTALNVWHNGLRQKLGFWKVRVYRTASVGTSWLALAWMRDLDRERNTTYSVIANESGDGWYFVVRERY